MIDNKPGKQIILRISTENVFNNAEYSLIPKIFLVASTAS